MIRWSLGLGDGARLVIDVRERDAARTIVDVRERWRSNDLAMR